MYGNSLGVPQDSATAACYLPNAASHGSSQRVLLPPEFHSSKLFFKNVDIRHFVIEPLFQPGTTTSTQH